MEYYYSVSTSITLTINLITTYNIIVNQLDIELWLLVLAGTVGCSTLTLFWSHYGIKNKRHYISFYLLILTQLGLDFYIWTPVLYTKLIAMIYAGVSLLLIILILIFSLFKMIQRCIIKKGYVSING